MPENTTSAEPLTPEQEAAWKAVTLQKLREIAERSGWLASPIAKTIFGLLAILFMGAGASVVSRFTAPPPVAEPVVISTDETGKLLVAGFADLKTTLGTGLGEIKTLLQRDPPAPKPPEPAPSPPSPDPDDWGETALPLEVKAESGRQVVIEAKVKGECRWLVPPGSPCDRFESGRKMSLTPSAAVDFAVGVVSIPDGVVSWTRIKAAPAPKPPEPKPPTPVPPAPKPPEPAPPAPTPPAPVSALTAKMLAAYKADGGPTATNRAQLIALIGLYSAGESHAKNLGIVTVDALLSDIRKVAYGDAGEPGMIRPDVLIGVRKVISAEVVATLGTAPGVKLDPDLRPKAVETFGRIAKSLGEVQ